ncbi:MAG: DUF4337 family protein, partial [Candidatus Angelobacter sp.]
ELKTSPSDGVHESEGLPTNGAAGTGAGHEGAVKIQERARDMERETDLITRKADRYDASELFLEISIVLCSISLLAETRLYWRLSFLSTAIGICAAGWGALMPH